MTRFLSGAVGEDVTLSVERWSFYDALAKRHGVTVAAVMTEVLRRYAAADPAGRERALTPAVAPAVEIATTEAAAAEPQLPRVRVSDVHDRVVELLDTGLSDGKVAKVIGVSQPTLSRYRREVLQRPSNGIRIGAVS
jgi:hypothetical protein